ncbi:MAG: NUDIX domain-containing protein [Sulfitobacter sp.]
MDLFVYGTLRHKPLLDCVLGRSVEQTSITPAFLADATTSWVQDQQFPMIQLGTGGQAQGWVLSNLSREDIARLDFYEGGFGYSLVDVASSAGTAKMYLPGPEVGPPGESFDLDDWVQRWGALTLEAAGEVMRSFGTRTAAEVAKMFPAIRTRAGARVRAAEGTADGFAGRVEIDKRNLPYAQFFALEDVTVRVERFEGDMTPPLQRAVFLGMDAALVLPYDPVRDRVLLVEQFRLGPVGRGDPTPWQLEPIAGHVDPGETPEQAARREAQEEAGLTLHRLETVGQGYPSPGASSEFYYMYVGVCDLPDDIGGVNGVISEGENIRSHLMEWNDFIDRIDTSRFSVAPLVLMGLWLARHRDRLQST